MLACGLSVAVISQSHKPDHGEGTEPQRRVLDQNGAPPLSPITAGWASHSLTPLEGVGSSPCLQSLPVPWASLPPGLALCAIFVQGARSTHNIWSGPHAYAVAASGAGGLVLMRLDGGVHTCILICMHTCMVYINRRR